MTKIIEFTWTAGIKSSTDVGLCPVLLQVSRPENGKDVNLKLVVTSNTSVALQLSINITVQAMRHNGTPAVNILSEVTEETLQPWKGDSSSTVASGTT